MLEMQFSIFDEFLSSDIIFIKVWLQRRFKYGEYFKGIYVTANLKFITESSLRFQDIPFSNETQI